MFNNRPHQNVRHTMNNQNHPTISPGATTDPPHADSTAELRKRHYSQVAITPNKQIISKRANKNKSDSDSDGISESSNLDLSGIEKMPPLKTPTPQNPPP